ncbi:MAG: hypothetical protein ABIH04_02635 [Planctomycetota bacterium]
MAGADKILVVVILVLSCVFLYTAVSVFGGGQKGREENEALLNQIEEKDGKIATLEAAGEAGAYIRLEETIKGLSDVATGLNKVDTRLKSVDDKVNETDKSAEKRIGDLGTYIKTLDGIIAAHSATIRALTEQLDVINEKILEQTKQINDLESTNLELKDNIAKSKERHQEELSEKDKEIKRLTDLNTGPGPDGPDGPLPLPPDVECEILNVVRNGDTTMVLLNKGSKDGLRVGHVLFVYNAVESYKGLIKVYKMEGEDRCFATIEKEGVGKKIAANDKAAVKTW